MFPPNPGEIVNFSKLWDLALSFIVFNNLLFWCIQFCSLSPKENLSGSFDNANRELFCCEESSDKGYNQREKY